MLALVSGVVFPRPHLYCYLLFLIDSLFIFSLIPS